MSSRVEYLMTCHDAGSPWCPCILADVGDCPVCPVLRGLNTCDECHWTGLCVYELRSRAPEPQPPREFTSMRVISHRVIGPDLHRAEVEVARAWVHEIRRPGAFILAASEHAPQVSAAPMAVLASDETSMSIVLRVRGPKTRALAGARDCWMVKGPFRSGLLGTRRLYDLDEGEATILVSTTGQSLLPGVLRTLRAGNNRVTVSVDPGSTGSLYVLRELGDFPGHLRTLEFSSPRSYSTRRDWLRQTVRGNGPDLVVSLGSDYLHGRIAPLIGDDQGWVASNNQIMVCGDGRCGSCSITLRDRTEIRGCKADVAPEDVFWWAAEMPQERQEG